MGALHYVSIISRNTINKFPHFKSIKYRFYIFKVKIGF